MIKYALACNDGHQFESWFANSGAYDKQVKRKLVTCPVCDSAKVEKAIMAPRLAPTGKGRPAVPAMPDVAPTPAPGPGPAADTSPVAMISPQEKEFRAKLKELRDQLVKNSDNVGKKFSEVARKMHYGEIEHRSIYGEATPKDAKEMLEEGIELHPLPVLPEDRN
jgi:hypothetical protein